MYLCFVILHFTLEFVSSWEIISITFCKQTNLVVCCSLILALLVKYLASVEFIIKLVIEFFYYNLFINNTNSTAVPTS